MSTCCPPVHLRQVGGIENDGMTLQAWVDSLDRNACEDVKRHSSCRRGGHEMPSISECMHYMKNLRRQCSFTVKQEMQ
jgi:hypothetical protein